jgi:hypothetical protein
MATTTDVGAGVQMIALERIRHDNNVRDVAADDVAALAGSIALLGQITPVIVRPTATATCSSPGTNATQRCATSAAPRSAPRSTARRPSIPSGQPKIRTQDPTLATPHHEKKARSP